MSEPEICEETSEALKALRHEIIYVLLDSLHKLDLDSMAVAEILDERSSLVRNLGTGEMAETTTERLGPIPQSTGHRALVVSLHSQAKDGSPQTPQTIAPFLLIAYTEGRARSGRIAQLVRAPALQAGCRGFESLSAHHFFISSHPIASNESNNPPFNTGGFLFLRPRRSMATSNQWVYFWVNHLSVGPFWKEEADNHLQIPRGDTGDGQRPLRRYAQIEMVARGATKLDKRAMQNARGDLSLRY